ncbi:MAG: HAMP domain-containing sensor histidine kinase [Bacteroidota bacterium]
MSITSKNRIILSVVMLIILSIINYYVQFGDINGLLFIGVIIFFSYQDDVRFSGAILFCALTNILWEYGDLANHKFTSDVAALITSSFRIIISILTSIGTHTFYLEKIQKETILRQKTELEKTNQELNKFIAMAAHDIRNPVASIKMITDFLVDDEFLTKESKEWVEIIQVSASNSLLILNNTLNISQIRSGKVEMSFLKEDYIQFVKDNLLINNHLATTKKQTILFQSNVPFLEVEFDKSRLVQVMNNLLNNAIKYSPEDSHIVIYVDYKENEKNEKYVKTTVKDEGMGIDEEFHDILYDAFSTTPNKPTNNESKTGLGLAIVKKIVELHHGKVGFTSVKGSGSEFYFCIPISQNS